MTTETDELKAEVRELRKLAQRAEKRHRFSFGRVLALLMVVLVVLWLLGFFSFPAAS